MLILDGEKQRVAYASDFENVNIEFTPTEWEELRKLFEFRLQTKPSTFAKATGSIYKKIQDNKPKLKSCYKEIE